MASLLHIDIELESHRAKLDTNLIRQQVEDLIWTLLQSSKFFCRDPQEVEH